MAQVHTYVNFNGNTEQAFEFYRSVFGGDFTGIVRFRDAGAGAGDGNIPEADLNKIMHIGLDIGRGHMLMGTDSLESLGQKLNQGNNSYIYLEGESAADAERLYEALSAGGQVEMALGPTPWAELYSSFRDRFGLQWMVSYTGNVRFGE